MGLKEEAILSYCEKLGVTPNIFIYRSVRHPYGKILQCRGQSVFLLFIMDETIPGLKKTGCDQAF